MPLDPSISLQVRPVEMPNMLAQYAQMMGIQGAQNQNALAQYHLSRAKREDETQNALSEAYKGAIRPDGSIDQNALYAKIASMGHGQVLPGIQKLFTEADKSRADLDKTKIETTIKKLELAGGAMAALSSAPTRANVMQTLSALDAQGVGAPPIPLPSDDALLPLWIKQVAMKTKHGLGALQAVQAKAEKVDTGGRIGFVNVNPLAGQVGASITGSPTIAKEQSPESRASVAATIRGQNLTDARARETADREKFSQPFEATNSQGQQVLVVQDKISGAMLDANTRQPIAGVRPKDQGATMPPQQAAQAQLLVQGRQDVQRAKDLLFDKNGKVNRVVLAQAQDWGIPGVSALQVGGVPFTQGRDLKSYIMNAVEGKLRLESGAAVPEQEVVRIAQRFVPSIADSDTTIEQKLNRLDEFMAGSLSMTKLPQAARDENIPTPQRRASDKSSGVIDFSKLPK